MNTGAVSEQLQSASPFTQGVVRVVRPVDLPEEGADKDVFSAMTDRQLLEYIARAQITSESVAELASAAVPALMAQLPTIIDALENWEGTLPLTIKVAMRAVPAMIANMGRKE